MWRKFDNWSCRHEILLFILAAVILLRIPTLLEPYWYGDEGIYLVIGQAINAGRELYLHIHDNKPPLLYFLAALAGGNLFWFKFIAATVNVVTIAVFWKLAHKLHTKFPALIATIFFALLTNLPLLEGNIANAELVFLLPTTFAFFLLYSHKKYNHIVIGGLLLGIAALIKMPAILEVGIWPVIWLFTDKQWFKKSTVLAIAAIIPILASIAYYASRGTLSTYLVAAGLQNVPYLSSWQAIPGFLGTLSGRAIVAAVVGAVLILVRKHIGTTSFSVGLWLVVCLFAGLLSGRPYPHYFLQLTAPLALFLGSVASGKKYAGVAKISLIILVIASAQIFRFYHYSPLTYYSNFFSFLTQSKTQTEYFASFNPMVTGNYEIAKIILAGSTKNDEIFVWGDEPMIYALTKRLPCGRYTAKYHILDFKAQKETLNCLSKNNPRYIITFNNQQELEGLPQLLSSKYLLEEKVGDAQIWRRMGYN